MSDRPPISYTFSAEFADAIKKLAAENNIGEHQVLERSIGLYSYAKQLERDGGRLIVKEPNGKVRVLTA